MIPTEGSARTPPRFAGLVWAVLRMQLQGWRNSTRRGLREDPTAAALGVIALGTTALFSLGFGAAMFVVTAFGGGESGLLFWMGFGTLASVTLVSIFSGAAGDAGDIADARRLQVYPVSRRDLIRLEVVAQVLSQSFLFFLPALLATGVGTAVAHVLSGRMLAAALPLPALAGGLVAGALAVRIVAGLVATGGRRVREAVAVLMAAFFMSFALVGPLVEEGRLGAVRAGAARAEGFLRAIPPGAAASLSVPESPLGALADAAILAAWLAAGWMAHARLAGRLLDGKIASTMARATVRRRERSWLGSLAGPAAGTAIADFRSMSRMPSLWILLLFPAVFGVAMGRSGHSAGDAAEAELAAAWLPVMAAFAAQVFFTSQLFSNLFGNDHAGTVHYVLAPVPAWRILAGKSASRMIFGAAQVAIFFGALSFRTGNVGLRDLLLGFAAWAAGALWVAAAGAFISIRIPFRMSTGVSHERGSRLLNSLLAQLLVASVLVPPALMVLGGRALAGEGGYVAGIAVSAAAGLVFWALSAAACSELWPEWAPRMSEDLTKG